MKILLVDQDAELCALLAFTLGQSGYECCMASDRAGALQLLARVKGLLRRVDSAPVKVITVGQVMLDVEEHALRIGSSHLRQKIEIDPAGYRFETER